MTWPFPPPNGPVPWTKRQIQEYEKQQRNNQEDALL